MSGKALTRADAVWKELPLFSISEVFADGDWVESKDQASSGIRLIQTGNIGEGEFKSRNAKARFIDQQAFHRLNCTEVHAGDILISRLPDPVGRACIVPDIAEPMITAVDCTIVRLDKAIIDSRFFVYYTQSTQYLSEVQGRCTGATRIRISRNNLGGVEVPLPPLAEQKRIVAVLDRAFGALDRATANAAANLEDAKALFRSELLAQYERGGAKANLLTFDELCEPMTPKFKVQRKDYLDEGLYPVVSQESELISGYWNDPAGLMGAGGPVVVFGDHTCCLKYVDFDFVVGADGTKVLKPLEGVSAGYLYYGLRSQPIGQSGYARHFKLLRACGLPALPIDEQHRLSDLLKSMEYKCDVMAKAYENKLADIAALRQSLLQTAFSAQLT